jgi:hypothetical protein
VHTASSAVFNSVTITATGIEAMVETINDATNVTTTKVKSGYSSASKIVSTVINIPNRIILIIIRIYNSTKYKIKSNINYIIETIFCLIADLLSIIFALIAIIMQPIEKFLTQVLLTVISILETNYLGRYLIGLLKLLGEISEKIQRLLYLKT